MSTTKERIEKWNKNFKSYNAFDEDLNTWLVMGNTYAIKDELKKKGAKFSRELGWHFDHEEPGYILEKVNYSQFSNTSSKGQLILDYEKADKVATMLRELHIEPSNSDYIGKIGEWCSTVAKLESSFKTETRFGTCIIYKFKDVKDNIIVIFSSPGKYEFEDDTPYVINGKIKNHSLFRGDKQTVFTKCSFEKAI